VVTIPGTAFGRDGEGFLRLSYGFADPYQITEALRRLDRFFSETT
jgi:aspartate/methionine/tyrosine aminotransferase